MTTKDPYRKDWMSDDQYACYSMLAEVVDGFHHIYNEVRPWGDGIQTSIYGGWSTYDFDQLTRLVVLAHDKIVRVEIGSSGPNMFRLILHKRHTREGRITEKHPTIEDAIERIRE